jgi:nicotinamide riboside kinase
MKTKTICVNLFGGPGCGKSTLAAKLFSELKDRKVSTELVREYVKTWAWEGRKVDPASQIYLLGKQASYENKLYGRVEYIVTDSPVLLAGYYATQQPDGKCLYVSDAALAYIEAHTDEVEYINILLRRKKSYDPRGRYETEAEAVERDKGIKDYLNAHNIEYRTCNPNLRSILLELGFVKPNLLERLWTKILSLVKQNAIGSNQFGGS